MNSAWFMYAACCAGLTPAGVICEIMNDDGTMARRNDLIAFAQKHNLKIGTISDLIAYRRRYDSIVRRLSENTFDSTYGGEFRCVIYVNKVTMAQHLALVKGDPAHGGPVMVRMHAGNIFTDLLSQRDTGRGGEIEVCMREIAKEGRGVLVLIRGGYPAGKIRRAINLEFDGLERSSQ